MTHVTGGNNDSSTGYGLLQFSDAWIYYLGY